MTFYLIPIIKMYAAATFLPPPNATAPHPIATNPS